MKKLILILFSIIFTTGVYANNAYQKAMDKNLKALNEAETAEELSEVANTFERIASMKADEWLPSYYSAYTNIRLSTLQQKAEAKDAYLDKAQQSIDKAKSLKKDDSEIVALQGFILMMKVAVDPASRGQSMAGKVTETFEKAVKLNPSNPRAQLLLGNWAYGTAQFFKSSTEEPCKLIKQSVLLFEKESQEGLAPHWGKEMATEMSKNCQ